MNSKLNWKELIIDFFIYLGVIVHLSMILPSPLGPGGQDIGIHLALILLLATRKINLKKLLLNKLSLIYLVFFILLALSTILYSETPVAMNAVRSRFKAVSLFFVIQILCFSDRKNDKFFVLSLFPAFLVYIALATFIPFLAGVEPGRVGGIRAMGSLWHNRTARLWNMVLPVTAASFFIVKSRVLKAVIAFFVLITLVGVPMTLSRAGTISLAALVLIFAGGVFFQHRRRLSWRRWAAGAAIAVAVAGTGLGLNWPAVTERFASADWTSFTGRVDVIWPGTLDAVRQRPVIGYGFSDFTQVTRRFIGIRYRHAHNLFLQVLFEGGVLTFAVFILMSWFFLKRAWKIMKREDKTLYGLSFISVFIAVMVIHGMIEYIRFIPFAFFLSSIWFYDAWIRLKKSKKCSGEK